MGEEARASQRPGSRLREQERGPILHVRAHRAPGASRLVFCALVLLAALALAALGGCAGPPREGGSSSAAPVPQSPAADGGGRESPFEGMAQPVSELGEVAPGVAELPQGGMVRTDCLGVDFYGSYDDEHIKGLIASLDCEEVSWYRSSGLDLVHTYIKLPDGADIDEEGRKFDSLEEVKRVGLVEYNPDARIELFEAPRNPGGGKRPVASGFDYGHYYLQSQMAVK